MNRFLIVGAGAREHAIAKALLRSKYPVEVYVIASSDHALLRELSVEFGVCSFDDHAFILDFAKRNRIEYAVIGGETPLAEGVVDCLSDAGVQCVGPKQKVSRIETSKGYARELMLRHNINGLPLFSQCFLPEEVNTFLRCHDVQKCVIKANGLMGGKGVFVGGEHFSTLDEAMSIVKDLLSQGHSIVCEEKLIGEEFSLMVFSDGKTVVPMPCVRDFKRALEGNKGLNTGGMGSYSLANHRLPFLSQHDVDDALSIMRRTLEVLQKENHDRYCGILYGGFMKTDRGIYVIEFNARFGDPEVLNVLSLLETDFVDVIQAMVSSSLDRIWVRFSPRATVCKYVVPMDYPNVRASSKEFDCSLIEDHSHLFFGSFSRDDEGRYFTASSRTLAYVAVADTLEQAAEQAEKTISKIIGDVRHRRDIPFEMV